MKIFQITMFLFLSLGVFSIPLIAQEDPLDGGNLDDGNVVVIGMNVDPDSSWDPSQELEYEFLSTDEFLEATDLETTESSDVSEEISGFSSSGFAIGLSATGNDPFGNTLVSNTQDGSGLVLSEFEDNVVPEPSSLALFLIAILSAWGYRRQK